MFRRNAKGIYILTDYGDNRRSKRYSRRVMAATRAAVCIAAVADNARIAFAVPPRAMAGIDANATVGCAAIAPSAEPWQPPRPANAAPLQYPANEGRDPSTFTPPATVFAKLGVSERTTPLHLKSCKLERWFQRSSARTLELVVIAPRRMVYEIVTTFDHYEGHGGAWGPGFRTFIVDAVTGSPIVTTTGGHRIRTSLPHVGNPWRP